MLQHKADSAKVAIVESQIKKIAFKKQRKLPASAAHLTRLRRGQWVATALTDKKSGEKSLVIRKIVHVTKKTVTIEIETYSSNSEHPNVPTVIQQKVSGYPKSFKVNGKNNFQQLAKNFKIISMKIKDGDKPVQDMSGAGQSPMVQLGFQGALQSIKFGKVTKMSCSTSYLKSSRCYNQPFEMGVLGFSFKGSNMQHSRVPIVGFISADSEQNHTEVLAYGFKGRKIIIK
jgi:hypothetical protein